MNCPSLVNKKHLLYKLVESAKPDIIIATKTWLNSQIHDVEFSFDHYSVYRHDRSGTIGSDILVAVKKDFVSPHEEDLVKDSIEMIWVKVIIQGCKDFI